jgi:hypothetical protein
MLRAAVVTFGKAVVVSTVIEEVLNKQSTIDTQIEPE